MHRPSLILRTGALGRAITALLALIIAIPLTMGASAPAQAAGEYLQITKTVDNAELAPGETFSYRVQVTCSEVNCEDAILDDALPDELIGFPIEAVTITPSESSLARDVIWTTGAGTSDTAPAVVDASTALHIDFRQPFAATSGLAAGETATVLMRLRVPADYPPGNSGEIVNTAVTSAVETTEVEASATIVIDSEILIDVEVDKTWAPAEQAFSAGATSVIELTASNTSNVPVDSLVIQEPAAAADGATALDASNPFLITDFTGFGTTALPASCTSVQVDAYVADGGAWNWVTGAPGDALALPASIATAQVDGLRITCTGVEPASIAVGATASIELELVQGADLAFGTYGVDNVATGSTALAGQTTAVDDGQASHAIVPRQPTVEAQKEITPNRIDAGATAAAMLGATNGAVEVTSLVISDQDFFTADIAFGGFTEPITFPEGATGGTVTFTMADGTEQTSDLTTANPPTVSGAITGFEIEFVGTIAAAATANAHFTITTTETATGDAAELTTTNTVDVGVEDSNEQTAEAADAADLTMVNPGLAVTLAKSVLPSTAVEPGQSVVAALETHANELTGNANLHEIVIEDVWGGEEAEFWNAFDLAAIAPTQVPGGAALTVEVRLADGSWVEVLTSPTSPDARVVQLTRADLAAALAPASTADVTGTRFSFENVGADGFAADTLVTPYLEFTARGTQRDGDPITEQDEVAQPYTNTATAAVDGVSDGGIELHDDELDTAVGQVVTRPGGPGPGGDIEKDWQSASVNAQTGDRADTELGWRVSPGLERVQITDSAADWGAPLGTVFDAFDLIDIDAIDASAVPYSNGWHLRYDSIVSIELWSTASSDWVEVTAPAGGWIQNGSFVGYTLVGDEPATTQGVRITLEENTDARLAAEQAGDAFDPYAPAAGSGVASTAASRAFDLTWQVRDRTRTADAWVTQDATYNHADAGVVDNDVLLTGGETGALAPLDEDSDTISILDQGPGVTVVKAVDPGEIFVPVAGTPAEDYPTATWGVEASNNSVSPASYLRVTDPASCSDSSLGDCQVTDPNANPFTGDGWLDSQAGTATAFDRFDLTGISIGASRADQVSLDDTVVWLLHYDAATGDMTPEQTTASAANALDAAALADVIGVSVTFQPANAGADGVGGTITQDNVLSVDFDTQLRPTIRTTGEPQTTTTLVAGETVEVVNRAFAQAYDPVLNPGAPTGDVDGAQLVLTGGVVNIRPSKDVSPDQVLQTNPTEPVTVTLGADQGVDPRGTLSPAVVTIEDHENTEAFWNAFGFTGLGAITLPEGATQVRVDVHGPFGANDADAWVEGVAAPAASAAVPVDAADYAAITGIRFTFTNGDDGELFSALVPAPNWSATAAFTVQLREQGLDGQPITFDESFDNTQTSSATRPDGNNTAVVAAADVIALDEGTRELAVGKLTNQGNRIGTVGEGVPFRLTLENTGTGWLTLEQVEDQLPPELQWLGEPTPVYTAADDGTLSEDVSLTVAEDGRTLTFVWPEDGRVMQPGEVFTIDIEFELQPGLSEGESATNTVVAQTAETLASCTNPNAPQQGNTGHWGDDPTMCGAQDYVTPASGPNLFTVKGVSGELSGAFVPSNPAATCTPTLATEEHGSFFRAPCVANSIVDGTDDWLLRAVNAGTTTVSEMVLFDQLPTPGDQSLISGNSRGTDYRPELLDSIVVDAPDGATFVVEVTTSPNVCADTWDTLAGADAQAACEQAGEVWTEPGADTVWSAVTGIRVSFDFSALAGGGLASGQGVDVVFSTQNVLASEASPQGAPAAVPSADSFAYNQVGVQYVDDGVAKKIAPPQVGTHLLTGALQIEKSVTGPAVSYAPDAFSADVACFVGDVELELGDAAVVALTSDAGYLGRIDGIPLALDGATNCVVTESTEFGQTSTTITPAGGGVVIDEATAADEAVPTSNSVVITNDYQFTGLSITKVVDTDAEGVDVDEEGVFGPFDFTVTCLSPLGDPVTFDDAGAATLSFQLMDGETFEAPVDRIPVGATCIVAETGADEADSIVIVGDNVVDNGDGSATVTPGTEAGVVTVTNGYQAGVLAVEKLVVGDGAASYGAGQFDFTAVCTYHGRALLDESFQLVGDGSTSFGPFPTGTECLVQETESAGATSTEISDDGAVTIGVQAPGEEPSTVEVTATNTFDTGSLEIVKDVVGDGAALYGVGPFQAQVVCTWERNGESQSIALPGNGLVTLTEENGYTATITDLLVGAQCAVTETATGGATASTIVPADGVVIVPEQSGGAPQGAVVTLTNTFDTGSLEIVKEILGAGALQYGAGPFTVEVACTWMRDGEAVPIALADGGVVTLSEENGYTATITDLLVGAECDVTETATGGATGTSIAPNAGTVTVPAAAEDGAAQAATVTITNTFDTGSLEIIKEVTGDGAELFGAGPFTAQATCTWVRDGETLPIELPGDGVVTLSEQNGYAASITDLIVGAECDVTETAAGGATSSRIAPDGGAVVIPPVQDGAAQAATVTITNTFDVTSLAVTKIVQGDLEADGASGPFTVALVCLWNVDGVETAVDIPGGADRILSEQNDYRASYDALPVGSTCEITETDTGGADGTLVTVAVDGSDRLDVEGTSAEVDLSATTGAGQAQVVVTNAFDAPVVPPELPQTGGSIAPGIVGGGLLLFGLGIALLVWRRRRESAEA